MTSAHFIFIPAVLLRAAADAYRAELKRREERQGRK
jgi:hypothetical protein